MTRAPRSASCRVAKGAATACSRATTVVPSSGSMDGPFRAWRSESEDRAGPVDHGFVDHSSVRAGDRSWRSFGRVEHGARPGDLVLAVGEAARGRADRGRVDAEPAAEAEAPRTAGRLLHGVGVVDDRRGPVDRGRE